MNKYKNTSSVTRARKGLFVIINKIVSSIAIIGFTLGVCLGAVDIITLIFGSVFIVWMLYCRFTEIRGYSLADSKLIIHRKMNNLVLSLENFKSAEKIDSKAISLSLGSHLNVFSWTGTFYSKQLGKYEAFLTNTRELVLIVLHDYKLVISPEKREAFTASLNKLKGESF